MGIGALPGLCLCLRCLSLTTALCTPVWCLCCRGCVPFVVNLMQRTPGSGFPHPNMFGPGGMREFNVARTQLELVQVELKTWLGRVWSVATGRQKASDSRCSEGIRLSRSQLAASQGEVRSLTATNMGLHEEISKLHAVSTPVIDCEHYELLLDASPIRPSRGSGRREREREANTMPQSPQEELVGRPRQSRKKRRGRRTSEGRSVIGNRWYSFFLFILLA